MFAKLSKHDNRNSAHNFGGPYAQYSHPILKRHWILILDDDVHFFSLFIHPCGCNPAVGNLSIKCEREQ